MKMLQVLSLRGRVDDAEVRQDAEEEGRLAVACVFGCVLLLIC